MKEDLTAFIFSISFLYFHIILKSSKIIKLTDKEFLVSARILILSLIEMLMHSLNLYIYLFYLFIYLLICFYYDLILNLKILEY